MIVKLTILVSLLAIAQSEPLMSARITAGYDAQQGQFPHQVSLQLGMPGIIDFKHFCGGSIIKSDWILTAAHCLDVVDETPFHQFLDFVVKAGKHDLRYTEATEQVATVKAYFRNQNFIGGGQAGPYDIGLIKLATPLQLNQRVAAIALPVKGSEPSGNVVLSGWGATADHNDESSYPAILQTTTVPIISRAVCDAAYEKLAAQQGQVLKGVIHETNICTGPLTGGISACSGDSGGPLISKNRNGKNEVIGVVSYGPNPCGREGGPSVYAKVSSLIDWIQNVMAQNSY